MPMNTNAARQPQAAAIGGMIAGATIAPTFAPELNSDGGERAFPPREPVRDRLDRRREVSAFAQAQRGARDHETARAADQRVRRRRRGSRPRSRRRSRSSTPKRSMNQPNTNRLIAYAPWNARVRRAVLGVRPTELGVQRALDQREDLPVDVVDGRREEQQPADQPAVAARWCSRVSRWPERWTWSWAPQQLPGGCRKALLYGEIAALGAKKAPARP